MIYMDNAATTKMTPAVIQAMLLCMEDILDWQKHCKWRRTVTVGKAEEGKKRITCECTPSPRDMALAAYPLETACIHR